MEYRTLNPQVQAELRVERVQEIEARHYRVGLLLEDADPTDLATAQQLEAELADLERRHALHLAVIEAAPDDPGEDGRGDDRSDDDPLPTPLPPPGEDDAADAARALVAH